MICCVSRAKMHFEHRTIEFSFNFALFFSIFSFSQFWVVLGWFHYEIRFPGEISCPGLPPDRSGIKFHAYSDFALHIAFMCRSVAGTFSIQKMVPRRWESNRRLRDIHKYMGKLWASQLNFQSLRNFKNKARF